MNKVIGLSLLAAGILLIIAGVSASQSFSSEVSKFFTGSVTDKALWMLGGGAACAVAGAVLMSRRA